MHHQSHSSTADKSLVRDTNYEAPQYVVFSIPVTPSFIVPNISLSTPIPDHTRPMFIPYFGNQISQPHEAAGKNYNSVYMNPCTQIWTHELLKTEMATRHCSTVVRRFPLSQGPRTPRAAVGRSVSGPVSDEVWKPLSLVCTQKLLCMHETARCTERSVRPSPHLAARKISLHKGKLLQLPGQIITTAINYGQSDTGRTVHRH